MPLQEPVVSIISMSNVVRWLSRSTSSSLPSAVSSSSRAFSSTLMSRIAWVSVGRGVT